MMHAGEEARKHSSRACCSIIINSRDWTSAGDDSFIEHWIIGRWGVYGSDMFDSRSSSSSNESYFLISITYLAAALYCIGALLLVFYIALSCRLISNLEADNMIVLLQSPSTLYMMLLVTALALVKDKMFVHVNTVTTPVDLKCIPTTRRKPQKPTLWGLSCTLFITLSLITLHSKGALTKLVDAVSSTDFLTTTDIVYSTMESIAKELLQQEIIPSDFRSTIHSAEYNSEGILKNNEYIAFCKWIHQVHSFNHLIL